MRKRLTFLAHTKPIAKEKLFLSAPRQQLPTATKLTSSYDFYPRQLTVSLQYTFSFSKNIRLASAVQLPFRTDSKPLRQRFVGKTGFGTSRRKFLQTHFRQSFESWVAGLRPACFLVTFCTMQKVTTRTPSQEAPRFCKPRISAPQPQLRTATIKTFLRKLRGFANLDAAHTNNNLAQNKLNPFFRLSAVLCCCRNIFLPQLRQTKNRSCKNTFLQLRFSSGHRPTGSAAIDKIIVARDK